MDKGAHRLGEARAEAQQRGERIQVQAVVDKPAEGSPGVDKPVEGSPGVDTPVEGKLGVGMPGVDKPAEDKPAEETVVLATAEVDKPGVDTLEAGMVEVDSLGGFALLAVDQEQPANKR